MHDMPVLSKMKGSDDGYEVHDREVLAESRVFDLLTPGAKGRPARLFF
jgi:hypothetical protein